MDSMIEGFDYLLSESVKTHGHLCPGQVLGVRMSILGLRMIAVSEPKGKDRKNIIVFVETDRCMTDAIQSVTGCRLGHRTMKFLDYGKVAATFLNLSNERAVRIVAKEDARQKAKDYSPEIDDKYKAQIEAYKVMPDNELFQVMNVKVELKPEDLPGRPLSRVKCSCCGEYIQDLREIVTPAAVLCKACAEGSYYTLLSPELSSEKDFFSPVVMQNCHNELAVRSKIWLEAGGEPVFGRGRKQLLKAVDKYGSINQAAKEVQISYKKAWNYIAAMEARLGIKLVIRHSGGKGGGGAALTKEAKEFLSKYERLEAGINELINRKHARIFHV